MVEGLTKLKLVQKSTILLTIIKAISTKKKEQRGYKRGRSNGGSRKQKKEDVDETSPVIQAFRVFQSELDAKHDKRERITKLSRDVTIESKRTIFLLHRINGNSQDEVILEEAEEKIKFIQRNLLSKISQELENEDIYMFLRAVTFGVQEYIEAVAFYHYIKDGNVLSEATFKEKFMTVSNSTDAVSDSGGDVKEKKELREKSEPAPEQDDTVTASDSPHFISFDVPPTDFFLGLADFTGEIMRLCINSIGRGDKELPFKLASFLRHLFEGFQLVSYQAGREMNRKLSILRQSLRKVENVCYTLQVRGSEIPKHMLLDAIETVGKQECSED